MDLYLLVMAVHCVVPPGLGGDTELVGDGGTIVVQCVEAAAEVDEEASVADGAEPEVIGRKESDGEEEA